MLDSANYTPRLKSHYNTVVRAALKEEFGYKNDMMIPRLEKIVLNMGLGKAIANPKVLEVAIQELETIAGQKPVQTRARKSISNFKLREGMAVGAKVTLRRERMFEILDRLINVGLPRVRDFKGINPGSFDGRGNYTVGIREQMVFPEVDYDEIVRVHGMDITFVTTAATDEQGRALLDAFGFPFRRQQAGV